MSFQGSATSKGRDWHAVARSNDHCFLNIRSRAGVKYDNRVCGLCDTTLLALRALTKPVLTRTVM